MLFLWILCSIFLIAIIILCIKIALLKKSMEEVCTELAEHLEMETNTLISISSRDRHVRYLAAELNRQLRQLRKQRQLYQNGNQELKDAITNMSHDLRTPLTAVFGYLELLDREEKSDAVSRYLELIQNRTQAMKQLTEELFRYSIILSAKDDLQLEMIDLTASLEESIASFYAILTERKIVPKILFPQEQVWCKANRAALSRVFENLLNNALKYSDGDLEIILLKRREIRFQNKASSLDEIQVGRLFDRFFSVENARNSTGLGLSIAKTLVEQMNGTITARYQNETLIICITLTD